MFTHNFCVGSSCAGLQLRVPLGVLCWLQLPLGAQQWLVTHCEATRMTREVASSAAKPRLGDSLAIMTPIVRVTL
jgi:hypothetical protein